jgi:pyrophosphatase PpaX
MDWAAILFDLDGTLADSVELILRCYRHTMRRHLGAERPDQEWIRGMGRPLRDQITAFARSPEEAAAMVETYVAHQRALHDELMRPYPGVVEALAALEARGVPMALVTSKRPELTRRALDRCGILRHFDVVITPDDVTRGKPDPEPVLLAMERLGVTRHDLTLFVGDSPHDIDAGRAAGVRTAAALWGPFTEEEVLRSAPDYLLRTIAELPELRP